MALFASSALINEFSNSRVHQVSKSTDVPNTHPRMTPYVEDLEIIATALGIDFAATGSSIRLAPGKPDNMVYVPVVAANGNQEACVFWGNVVKPLKDVKAKWELISDGKISQVSFEVDEVSGDTVELPLMQPKDNKADYLTLKAAVKKGTLGQLLAKSFVKAKSLSALFQEDAEAGEEISVTIASYSADLFKGETKYEVNLVDGTKPLGVFKANRALSRKLAQSPEMPVNIVLAMTSETVSGNPIIALESWEGVADSQPVEVFSY